MSSTNPAMPGRSGMALGPLADARPSAWRRFFEQAAMIVGAIALFLGLFVLFAGENQSIGFFGVWSMPAQDVSGAWTTALLVGGGLLLALSLYSVIRRRRGQTRPER
jgi:TRAP-type C4-dicarboxylate transport system permease small subunit